MNAHMQLGAARSVGGATLQTRQITRESVCRFRMSQAKPIPRPAPLRPAARPHQAYDSSVRMKSQPPVAMRPEATGPALVQARPVPPQAPPAARRPPPPLPVTALRPSPPPLPLSSAPPRVAPQPVAAPVLAPMPRLDALKPAMVQPPLGAMPAPVINPLKATPPPPLATSSRLRDDELPDGLDGTARRRRMAFLFAALALLAVGGTAAAAISSHF